MGRWFSSARDVYTKATPHLRPIIEDRLAKMQELGDKWTDKPVCPQRAKVCIRIYLPPGLQNDLVQWTIEVAVPKNIRIEKIVERMLLGEFAAISTSSNVRRRCRG